ncbi:MAG: helix-turn-helix transcriptional regulator [Chloroflexi bacterium]|nr:MAG: helix-turn-helix transcriptional regulator [Chloroflexota bacterium]
MSRAVEESNRRMLRARDAMDRTYAEPLDITSLARIACVSEAHFIRTFRATFGETPHRYLQCMDVGFSSLGTFSRTFRDIVGESPSSYRRGGGAVAAPTCFVMAWTRPAFTAVSEKPAPAGRP